MRKIICKYFGHKWIYSFILSSTNQDHTNIRVCSRCKQNQYWKKDIALFKYDILEYWSNMITYTDLGAKEKLGNKYQK